MDRAKACRTRPTRTARWRRPRSRNSASSPTTARASASRVGFLQTPPPVQRAQGLLRPLQPRHPARARARRRTRRGQPGHHHQLRRDQLLHRRQRPRPTAPRLLRLRLLHRRPGRQGARRTRRPRPRRQHHRRPLGRPRLVPRRLRHHRQAHRPRTRARVAAHHPPARQPTGPRSLPASPPRAWSRPSTSTRPSPSSAGSRRPPRPSAPRWCRCCATRSPPARTTPTRAMAR